MPSRFIRRSIVNALALATCLLPAAAFGQGQEHHPGFGPLLRPKVKMVGFLNAKVAETETRPVVTIALPADEKRYTFLLDDMKILAGPIRTPGSILSEVKPYSTNFYIRTSQEMAAQISSAAPTEPLTIIADYSSADRVLFVQGVEKGGEEQQNSEKDQH